MYFADHCMEQNDIEESGLNANLFLNEVEDKNGFKCYGKKYQSNPINSPTTKVYLTSHLTDYYAID